MRIAFFFGDIPLAGETAYLHLNQKRAFQNSRFAFCTVSMGFKRKADPAEVEEIEDEEEATLGVKFLNHPCGWLKSCTTGYV